VLKHRSAPEHGNNQRWIPHFTGLWEKHDRSDQVIAIERAIRLVASHGKQKGPSSCDAGLSNEANEA
jgi:hypothetical protein